MGIPRLTIQEVRRDVVTKMLDLKLPPTVPTGMSHGHGTQVIHYDENTEERGIQSKLAANEQVFRQEADLDSDSDSEHQEMLRKENNEVIEGGIEVLADKWKDEDWKNFTTDSTGRSGKKKILVEERFRLLYSIYNLDSLEWSCLFLSGDRQPSSLDRMGKHLERYLYSDNPNVKRIREDFATIAASLDMFTEVNSEMFRKLAGLIRESFRSLNRKRLEGRGNIPKLHVLLNFNYLNKSRGDDSSGTSSIRSSTLKRPGIHYF
jgi:hypothetical protein